jgi:hypothetical protein
MEILELEHCAYTVVIDPVNLEESVLPNVNSPFSSDDEVVGSKDTATRSDGIVPWLERLSVTVGISLFVSGDKVPIVKSTGPILGNKIVSTDTKRWTLCSPEDTVETIEPTGG